MALQKNKKRIGDMLIEERLLTQGQLETALQAAKESHSKIGETLVKLGFTTDEKIVYALSNQLRIPVVSLNWHSNTGRHY